MPHPRALLLALVTLGTAACITIERPEVVGEQLDGVWIFRFVEDPLYSNNAALSGEAAVVEGCLEVGEAVVIWRDEHLDTVQQVLDIIAAGGTPALQFGGGGYSLDEGGTVDGFPDAILEHCTTSTYWEAAGGEITLDPGE